MNQSCLDLQPTTDYRTIRLSDGRLAIVDPSDYPDLVRFRWLPRFRRGFLTIIRNVRRPDGKISEVLMWRQILNPPDGKVIDHINHNRLDNRRSNLRICTVAENTRNQVRRSDNTSGIKGVSWDSRSGKWYAKITLDYRQIALGKFTCKHQAAQAYRQAAEELHGQFHHLG